MRVNLIQRSPEWHEWRKDKIGGSDISSLTGNNPWCSRNKLWKKKLGILPQDPMNSHIQRGIDLEDTARELAERELNAKFTPACYQDDTNPLFISSLDGLSDDGQTILEVKCPYKKMGENIPLHYLDQIQWQLGVVNAAQAFLVIFTDGELDIRIIYRDERHIQAIRKEAELFLNQLKNLEEPEATDSDCEEIVDEYSVRLSIQYDLLDLEIKNLEAQRETVRAQLTEKAKEGNIRVGNLIISKVRRPGAIDYGKIEALKEIDLELFRKPPIESYRITRKK